jgi:hypothetical protein
VIEQAIVAMLEANGPLNALLANRVYPANAIPQDAGSPRVTIKAMKSPAQKDLQGASNLQREFLCLEVQARSAATAKTIADLIRQLVKTGAAQTIAGFVIRWIWYEGEEDDFASLQAFDEKGYHRISAYLTVWFEE